MDATPEHKVKSENIFSQTQGSGLSAAFKSLIEILNEFVTLYRGLLDNLRKEKAALVAAEIKEIQELNKEKENILYKLKVLDSIREKRALELGIASTFQSKAPRLLELASHIGGKAGDELRGMHATLSLLVTRANELNKENEIYAQSALKTLNGALDEVKTTLAGKPTYGQKGKMTVGPERSGNFVSKEA